MKSKLLFTLLIGVITVGYAAAQRSDDWSERDEFNRTYRLSTGAAVDIYMIHGPVNIETIDGDTAEVHIIRSARRREDLNTRPIFVEQNDRGLSIHGERDNDQGPARVRHSVTLRVPRRVSLSIQHVNARVSIGEINGPVTLSSINGSVRVGRAVGTTEITGINGSLTMNLDGVSDHGLRVEDVNGAVDLRFETLVNADLHVSEYNGSVTLRLANVTVLERRDNKVYTARIGGGGSQITLRDINGGINFSLVGN